MHFKEKSNRNKWKQHKKPKTAMMRKFWREKGKRIVRWMIGRIGIRRAKVTLKESETLLYLN
jgi:hypothetical protein